jgi:hypothetical protein
MAQEPAQQPSGQPQQPAQGGFMGLVSNVYQQLGMIQDVLSKANAGPELAQRFASIQDQFQAAVEALQGGGDEGQEMAPKNPEGATSPEAGAAEVMPM